MSRRRASPVALTLLGLAACATMGTPRTFRFASNREADDARTCAELALRRHDFTVVPDTTRADATAPADSTAAADSTAYAEAVAQAEPTTRSDTTVMVRRPHRASDGPGEWWRAKLWLDQDQQRRTVVVTVLGASRREAGPYGAPPEALEEVGSDITARCMW